MRNAEHLLVDTHVWIWLMNGDHRLKAMPTKAIDSAAAKGGVLVSAISVWELGMLESKGRIVLQKDIDSWTTDALHAPGVSLQPITPRIALASSRLPGEFHGDPAARLLVATARELGCTLATHDERIITYGKEGFVTCLAC